MKARRSGRSWFRGSSSYDAWKSSEPFNLPTGPRPSAALVAEAKRVLAMTPEEYEAAWAARREEDAKKITKERP